jgi:hypothetical protein
MDAFKGSLTNFVLNDTLPGIRLDQQEFNKIGPTENVICWHRCRHPPDSYKDKFIKIELRRQKI